MLPVPQLLLPGIEATTLLLWKRQESRSEISELGVSVSAAAVMPFLPLRLAVVCSSNQNRSMEAHNILSKRGFSILSFGTGTNMKLPGPARDRPNVYDFRAMYDDVYKDLLRKDKERYMQNGVLRMLERNMEKEMATHSSILAWRIPWMEELGGLQSMGRKSSPGQRGSRNAKICLTSSSPVKSECMTRWWKI